MSLASGLRVGGVFVDVKLDTSGLAGQFRDLKSQMDRLARQHQLAVPMGAAQGSTSSTGGGSRPIMPSFAIGGSQAGVISAICAGAFCRMTAFTCASMAAISSAVTARRVLDGE